MNGKSSAIGIQWNEGGRISGGWREGVGGGRVWVVERERVCVWRERGVERESVWVWRDDWKYLHEGREG
jgi:hypothetical protein